MTGANEPPGVQLYRVQTTWPSMSSDCCAVHTMCLSVLCLGTWQWFLSSNYTIYQQQGVGHYTAFSRKIHQLVWPWDKTKFCTKRSGKEILTETSAGVWGDGLDGRMWAAGTDLSPKNRQQYIAFVHYILWVQSIFDCIVPNSHERCLQTLSIKSRWRQNSEI